MMNKLLYLMIILGFISCGNEKNKMQSTITETEKSIDQNTFTEISKGTSSFNLTALKYKGQIKSTKYWLDANGENIALFCKEMESLFVYHYSKQDDKITLQRKIQDFEKNCAYDLYLDYLPQTIVVKDVDNNNYGELTFAYRKACISDVSPLELKLLIVENGKKFIIRGSTKIAIGGLTINEVKNIDPSFMEASQSIQVHGNKMWDKAIELSMNY